MTNIKVLEETMEEASVVRKILRAVPDKFLQIASNIEQFGDVKVMTIEEVVGRLKAHEERMKGKSENTCGQLLLTQEEWVKKSNKTGASPQGQRTRGGHVFRGRGRGNFRNNGGGRGQQQSQTKQEEINQNVNSTRDQSTVKCFNCNVYGHYAMECRKPRREKDKNKEQTPEANLTKFEDDEPTLLLTECENRGGDLVLLNGEIVVSNFGQKKGVTANKNMWYLDNGASNYMTGHREKFCELNENVTGQVRFGDGSTVKIERKGTIVFKCKNGEEHTLREVYIPSLCNNIISLGQLSEDGNKVVLNEEHLWVYDEREKLLIKVRWSENRLYKIVIENYVGMCMLSKAEEQTWLWNSWLGHVNFQTLHTMSEREIAIGLPKLTQPKAVGNGCLLEKQARKPFPQKIEFSAEKN